MASLTVGAGPLFRRAACASVGDTCHDPARRGHSASSDVPVWSTEGRQVFYTAKFEDSIELMRVDLDGKVTQLTKSKPGTRHYHPAVSPDGKWILFGSDRSGIMQLYIANTDGSEARPITNVPAGYCAMHGFWQPVIEQK